ncbi:Lin0512 family protein [Caldanaerobacter subterraneus]|uniref:Uncharacterized protein (TIGR02058 family) n=1 Tax=Caldanaerobacter subterraneus TaxID=911092 RepID=A0A4R2K547_9THEO|nr:Lin0512 family protein [Caldanaerobacter subterraneus]TCO66957.1 uncharacterized protein (TIGR02058 family) [Caldanaerobacter subterraneus]
MEVISIKRYVVEFGYGVDLHGQDVNKAAQKAVKDAISHSCLCGLEEILGVNLDEVIVEAIVAVSRPEEIDEEGIKAVLPIGQKYVKAVKGGLRVPGIKEPQFGDTEDDSIEVAVACVTVSIK